MSKIVDQYGNPIDRGTLKEPQTSRIAHLENQFLTPMLAGLTPARLAQHLRAADDGDLTAQHRLFADMEERDAHISCEVGKRKLAVMRLDWDIVPPRNATAKEKADAAWVKDVLTDAQDPFEDLLLALMDGVGHGFAPVELEWRQEGRDWLPAFLPRPQEWLRLDRLRRELRLLDLSAEGAPLQPFGWVLHTHGKPKAGYLGRAGLHRTLVWPFIYKAYALGDFAEFIETYGLPMIVGKYYKGASDAEKASLMRAVTALGHDARAIMPTDMTLEVQKVTGSGDSTPHLAMMAWAEAAISKAILGQTLSSTAAATGMGSGVADLQAEVRDDIRDADAKQIAGTVTRDLIYALLALNRGVDSLSRCARLVFDTGEADDITAYAEALPKLVDAGMTTIPVEWVHERLRIPQPADGEPTLGAPKQPDTPPDKAKHSGGEAALSARGPLTFTPEQEVIERGVAQTLAGFDSPIDAELIREAIMTATDAADLDARLAMLLADLPRAGAIEVAERALAAARLLGWLHAG